MRNHYFLVIPTTCENPEPENTEPETVNGKQRTPNTVSDDTKTLVTDISARLRCATLPGAAELLATQSKKASADRHPAVLQFGAELWHWRPPAYTSDNDSSPVYHAFRTACEQSHQPGHR